MASDECMQLILMMREHPAFEELMRSVPKPTVPAFKQSKAASVQEEQVKWIFRSGARHQHESWVSFLSGKPIPPEAE
jgi:hypothetical protein